MKNTGRLLAIAMGEGLVFAYAVERLFAESRGLSIADMQNLIIFYAVISALLEIPCGALADVWKKKYVLAAGLFICYFEFVCSIFSYDLYGFGIAYLAAAIGGSLKSGVTESILYMSLKEHGREEEYVKWNGRCHFAANAVLGLSGIAGGYLAYYTSYEIPYWLSLLGFPICLYFALTLEEPEKGLSEKKDQKKIRSQLKAGIVYAFTSRRLLVIILASGISGSVLHSELHEMSMLVYPEIGIAVLYFGYISFLITGSSAAANLLSEKYESRGWGLKPAFAAAAAAIFLFGFVQHWSAVLYVIAAIAVLEMISPILSARLQEKASDEWRVTVTSIEAFTGNLLSIVIGMGFGYAADLYGVQLAFQLLSCILLVLLLFRLNPE
ncbi:MFS transporter [Bacillus sp. FJAT-42376]|uniref:MFS transporter n=1 Tax=Bacillus sp. FJAT-42376 TaxID=2014076 RepID=UPI0013DE1F49|nr:MFS transporter [Bacillus sp. FJAT-42376]